MYGFPIAQFRSRRGIGTDGVAGRNGFIRLHDRHHPVTVVSKTLDRCRVRADSPFRRGPLRTLGDVELITADYVAWYNQQRLMHRLGRVPPTEAEARYYAQHVTDQPVGSQNPEGA